MARIILIACSKTQKQGHFMARDLYQGDLFKVSLAYAEGLVAAGKADYIYILSTHYGLLDPRRVIDNYNIDPQDVDWAQWSQNVLGQLKNNKHDLSKDRFLILAGHRFWQDLVCDSGIKHAKTPLKGLPIGKMKQQAGQWLP